MKPTFLLAVGLTVLAAKPIWAQQENPNSVLMAQLEQRLAESDSEARQLTGGPKNYGCSASSRLKKLSIG